jgi:Icc-related predicted phosphoesterase
MMEAERIKLRANSTIRNRGRNISKHWKKIPANTDIQITHGPPYGILDKNRVGFSAGCQSLKRVVKRIKPMLHVFGHIHERSGMVELVDTTFVNVCVYFMGRKRILLDVCRNFH